MAYNGLTNAGAAYKAAREANNLPVEFLKAKVGNGIVPSGTDPAELTDIISGKMEVEITDIHQVERALKMTVQVSNESLATGFYLTEIAIYVNDNGTPVLYWYIGKDNGTYVPDSTKPMKYKNILNIEVSSTPVTTVNYTGKDLWIDEETLNAKFGTGEREILEGIRLAQILGLEFAGELNNSNTKKANKVYYDTQNKSYFKCLNDNVLNYADSNYYEGISNNDLLLKLQNLNTFLQVNSYNGNSSAADFFSLSFTRVGGKVFVNGMIYPDNSPSKTFANKIPMELKPIKSTSLAFWTLNTGNIQVSAGKVIFNTDLSLTIESPPLSQSKPALISGFYEI